MRGDHYGRDKPNRTEAIQTNQATTECIMPKQAVKLVVGGQTTEPTVRQELIGYLLGATDRQPYFGGLVFWQLNQSLDFNVCDIDHQMALSAQAISKDANIIFMVFDQSFKPQQMLENWQQIKKAVSTDAVIYIVQIEGSKPDEQAIKFATEQNLLFAHITLDNPQPAKILAKTALKTWSTFTVLDDDERAQISSAFDQARLS